MDLVLIVPTTPVSAQLAQVVMEEGLMVAAPLLQMVTVLMSGIKLFATPRPTCVSPNA